MKLLMILIPLSFSLNLSAQEKLMLNAACKASCIVEEKYIDADQGYPTIQKSSEAIYIDLIKLSRKEIDSQSASKFHSLCKKRFGQQAYLASNSTDCVLFKN